MGLAVGDKQMWLRAKATARDTLCLSSRPAYFTPFVKRASSVSNHERHKIRNACIKQHRGAFPVTTVAARSIILSNRTIFFSCAVVALFYGLEIKLQKLYHFHRSVTKHIYRTLTQSNGSVASTALEWASVAYVNTNQQSSSALTPGAIRCRPYL